MVLAAGCGSSSSSTSVTKADFVAKANAICNKVNDKITSLPKISTAQDLVTTGPKEIAAANQGISELKALQLPDSIKTQVTQYFSTLAQESSISNKLITAFKNKDGQALTQAENAGKAIETKGHAQAVALGLTACAKQSQPTS
jgi:hypothetical protein